MKTRIIFLAILLFAANYAVAATQGTEGASSTGIVNVSLDVGYTVQISNLTDITMAQINNPGVDPSSGTTNMCIKSGAADGRFQITIESANASSCADNFCLKQDIEGSTEYINYTCSFNDRVDGYPIIDQANTVTLTQNIQYTPPSTHTFTDPTCINLGGFNFDLLLNIPASNSSGKAFGTYTDTLTITVAGY